MKMLLHNVTKPLLPDNREKLFVLIDGKGRNVMQSPCQIVPFLENGCKARRRWHQRLTMRQWTVVTFLVVTICLTVLHGGSHEAAFDVVEGDVTSLRVTNGSNVINADQRERAGEHVSPSSSPDHVALGINEGSFPTNIALRLQKTEWELNTVKHSLGRHKVMLSEARDNMLDSYKHSREYIAKYESNILASRDVPCYCMELSAMAPQDSWCDNPLKGRLSGSHVCILNNVCVGAGKQLIFVSERSNSKSTSEHRRMSTAGVDIDGEVVYRGNPLYDEAKKAPVTEGTAVLYASKFAGHITHVQEGAGSLMLSIHRMKDRSTNCNRSDLTCFPQVSKFLFFQRSMMRGFTPKRRNVPPLPNSDKSALGDWQENILRVMINDQEKSVAFADPALLSARPLQCFEKAIVPGFYYSVFPSSEDVSQFQTHAREYIKRNAKFEESSNPVILLARRTTKRSVVDWDVFVSFVKEVAADYNKDGKAVTVEEIEYGRHSFEEQVSATAKADILMGLHGADLTNMMFMNRGSVLIEMNPFLFYETRFFELSATLGIHYVAWTCTNPSCAFGGSSSMFSGMVGKDGYDNLTRRFQISRNHSKVPVIQFMWPYDRFVGNACPLCNEWLQAHPLVKQQFFSTLRDSNVRIGQSLHEIRNVLTEAFRLARWTRR